MKKYVFVLAACLVALVTMSCATTSGTTRVSADAQIDLTGRWNDSDVRIVCDTLIADALASPRIDAYIKDFAGKNGGELPTVIVGRFKNASSEHIDTSIISGIMRTAIINSGKLEFVEGGDMREAIREERQDQQANASEATASALANETGANFMMTGEVNATVEKAGNTTVRAYFVKASITNMETNRILWEGQNNEIKKVFTQAKAKL
jgi:uncharacterized protein (TIGR02722 family)